MMEEKTCVASLMLRGWFSLPTEEEVASDDRSSMRPRQIGSVHVKKKMHVAGVVGDAIIAPGRSVAEGTVSSSHGHDFLCRVGLLGCDFICDGQE